MAGPCRILGIDPGSVITGYGIIENRGRQLVHVHSGRIQAGRGAFPERLWRIHSGIAELVSSYQPDEVAVEKVFVSRNVDSALKLGQARGAAICGAFGPDLPVAEYAAGEIKQAVVGGGRAAKEQVQHMVAMLLSLRGRLQEDQADALAVAICHAHMRASRLKMAAKSPENSA